MSKLLATRDANPVKTSDFFDMTLDKAGKKRLQGTSYSHYGARSGMGSMLDGGIIQKNLQRQKDLIGDGFVRFQAVGDVKDAKPINIGGRLIYPDEKGQFTIIDEGALNILTQREEERRAHIESMTEKAALSNQICGLLLGMSEAGVDATLGKGKDAGGVITSPELIDVDATPDAISTYAPGSLLLSQAIQKLRQVIAYHYPVVDTFTTKEKMAHADEKI